MKRYTWYEVRNIIISNYYIEHALLYKSYERANVRRISYSRVVPAWLKKKGILLLINRCNIQTTKIKICKYGYIFYCTNIYSTHIHHKITITILQLRSHNTILTHIYLLKKCNDILSSLSLGLSLQYHIIFLNNG